MEKKEKNVRFLTVTGLYVPGNACDSRFVPFIRICGKWLKESGFDQGQKVRVWVEDKRLVVEVV